MHGKQMCINCNENPVDRERSKLFCKDCFDKIDEVTKRVIVKQKKQEIREERAKRRKPREGEISPFKPVQEEE